MLKNSPLLPRGLWDGVSGVGAGWNSLMSFGGTFERAREKWGNCEEKNENR
jgi:hypothetical protein